MGQLSYLSISRNKGGVKALSLVTLIAFALSFTAFTPLESSWEDRFKNQNPDTQVSFLENGNVVFEKEDYRIEVDSEKLDRSKVPEVKLEDGVAWVEPNGFFKHYDAVVKMPESYDYISKCSGDSRKPDCSQKIPESSYTTERPYYVSEEGSTSVYVDHFSGVSGNNIHFHNLSANPNFTGYGKEVLLNVTVASQEQPSNVEVDVTFPDSTTETYSMSLTGTEYTNHRNYEHVFKDAWQRGIYSYRVSAETSDNQEFSSTKTFEIESNASMNVVTEKDRYGALEEVDLTRSKNITANNSEIFDTTSRKRFRRFLFSDNFRATTGTTSGIHTFTHEFGEGETHDLTENNGGFFGTDIFDGQYNYSTDYNTINNMRIDLTGVATGGALDIQIRNYDTASWETAFTLTSTTTVNRTATICTSEAACSSYKQGDGTIQLRAFASNGGATADETYSIDYLTVAVETDEGQIDKVDDQANPDIGLDGNFRKRWYSKYNLRKLPINRSANIESAYLLFDVLSGDGTGEIYHTRNFDSGSPPTNIHAGNLPPESTQTNPIQTFATTNGLKEIEVSQAVSESFESGKREVGFQFREQGQDQSFTLSSRRYLMINYTAESELVNTGSTDMNSFLLIRAQKFEDGSWNNVGFPTVDQTSGRYPVESDNVLDLAQVWNAEGGFNTEDYRGGEYRILSEYVNQNGRTLENSDGSKIRDMFEFEVFEPYLNLSEVQHENQVENSVNEFGTGDTIDFVDTTVDVSRTTAVNASVNLKALNENNQVVEWGPDSTKNCGDVAAGSSCEKSFTNSSSGYEIPRNAFFSLSNSLDWRVLMDANNFGGRINTSQGFTVYHTPAGFESNVTDEDNKILRNRSVVYNFTVQNPWSAPLEDVNVSINCNQQSLNCSELGATGAEVQLGSISADSTEFAEFNVTTNSSTPTGFYDLNATVEYVNPGGEEKQWVERENEILAVRIAGALTQIIEAPVNVTRGQQGYKFNSSTENTFADSLTGVNSTYTLPFDWTNATGNLTKLKATLASGETFYHAFNASVGNDANLGARKVRIDVTNDQLREDSAIADVDVYANTTLSVTVNQTDPAVGESVKVVGRLRWDNGTVIPGEVVNFSDTTSGENLGAAVTDETGEATVVYEPEVPLGSHVISGIYRGSKQAYTNPSSDNQVITVHKIPDIQNVQAQPGKVGYGYPVDLSATVTDSDDGVAAVDVNVTYPNGTLRSFSMQNTNGDTYKYQFSDTWVAGKYDFKIVATDNAGKVNTSMSNFTVDIQQSSTIGTQGFEFFPGENVTLTNSSYAYTLKQFDYRKPIEVIETSGSRLKKFASRFVLSNLGGKVQNDCSDIRMVENGTPRDLFIESCNPSGNTVAWAPTTVEASSTEADLFAYYDNPDAENLDNETFAFPINDADTVDPGAATVTNTHQYNGGDAIFRKIEITANEANGNTMAVTVQARNISTGNLVTLYDQTGVPSGTTVVDEIYYERPWYNEVQVAASSEAGGGAFDPQGDISYTYNYTTPDFTDTQEQEEQDRFSSVLQNLGDLPFRGRVVLEVFTNNSGTWQQFETVYTDSTPRNVNSDNIIEFYQLWNADPFFTNRNPPGFYRAVFKLVNPSGTILTDGGEIRRTSLFRLNPSQADVRVQNVSVYNVTGAGDQRTDTSDLEDSGLNTSLRLTGGEEYRVEVEVENDETASAAWEIDGNTDIRYININPSWTIDTANDVFYDDGATTYTGGQRQTAPGTTNVTWNSQGGQVAPGTSANFSFIAQVPNQTEPGRNVTFSVTDITFRETDRSDIYVYENNNVPPMVDFFDLNTTDLRRGESVKAFANWTKDISSALAEYNATTAALSNYTVNPQNSFTNYSFSTNPNWLRGTHTFQFFADDYVGNQGSSRTESFDVNGIANLNDTYLNESEVEGGETVRFECQVTSDRNNPIQGYSVNFYNETAQIDSEATNATGWAGIDYTSNKLGEQLLKCNITESNAMFYEVGVTEGQELLKVIETVPPEYQQFGQNATRVFKTAKNDTINLYARWTDNFKLDTAVLSTNETGSFLNSSLADPIDLEGTADWSNFSVDVQDDVKPVDAEWRIYANDTSSNYNVTSVREFEIWGFTRIFDPESGADQNPITVDEGVRFRCEVRQGNGSAVTGLPVKFYDNSSGSMQLVATNSTNSNGEASVVMDYSSQKVVNNTCSIARNDNLNFEPFSPELGNFSENVKVIPRETIPPSIQNNNYFLNTTVLTKPGAVKSAALWNETIGSAKVEFNYSGEFIKRDVPGPFTNNWTNYTVDVNQTWDVGTHYVKTSVNDTDGNTNDTLNFLKFDVFGRSKVEWISPTGKVGKGNTELKCRVGDVQTDEPISNYEVAFYDDKNDLIGTNQTRNDGTAIYHYNTSNLEAGNKTWSCRINNEPELFYNTSNQDTDSEEVELLEQLAGQVSGNLTRPVNNTVVAQNKTFRANVTAKCSTSDCGEVTAALRYNQSGNSPDTQISDSPERPFHTIGSNPKTCSASLGVGENCSVSWQVNATAAQDTDFALDAELDGAAAPTNDTEDKQITVDQILILNVNYTEVDFPQGDPGQVVAAPGNTEDRYYTELDERSNDANGGAWIKLTNLTKNDGSGQENERIPPENTTWSFESTCAYSGSTSLRNYYTRILSSLEAGESFTQCYWQETPFGKYAGIYNGTLTIKVNATN